MHTYKLQVTVPKDNDREISVHLPDDFPSGPAEVIVLAALGASHGTPVGRLNPLRLLLRSCCRFKGHRKRRRFWMISSPFNTSIRSA